MRSPNPGQPTDAAIIPDAANANWSGQGQQLAVGQNANMTRTANGTMIFMYFNQSTENNAGQLSLSSGGSLPSNLDAPALSSQPSLLINNWNANNLSVTNNSANNNTPIWISAYGPGVPGQTPAKLPIGTPVPLQTTGTAQGTASPQWMNLVMQCGGATLCILGVIGGPADASGNNGYVIALNASQETGPPTGNAPPAGYYATTMSNSYTFRFNWGSSSVYVVNMSPATGLAATVTLSQL